MKNDFASLIGKVKEAQSRLKDVLEDTSWVEDARKYAEQQSKDIKKLVKADVNHVKKFLETERKELDKFQKMIPGEVEKFKKFVDCQKKEFDRLLDNIRQVHAGEEAPKAKAAKKRSASKAKVRGKKASA